MQKNLCELKRKIFLNRIRKNLAVQTRLGATTRKKSMSSSSPLKPFLKLKREPLCQGNDEFPAAPAHAENNRSTKWYS